MTQEEADKIVEKLRTFAKNMRPMDVLKIDGAEVAKLLKLAEAGIAVWDTIQTGELKIVHNCEQCSTCKTWFLVDDFGLMTTPHKCPVIAL